MNEKKIPTIALVMMLKDEEKSILVSFESVKNYIDEILIYDTGSVDNTIANARKFAEDNKIPIHIYEGKFETFSISRNFALDRADELLNIDYILLLDARDELIGGEELKKLALEHWKDNEHTGFLLCQEWRSDKININKYYNTRFIKPRSGWRYKAPVHEYLAPTDSKKSSVLSKVSDNIILYQDRDQDGGKSQKRFTWDRDALLKELKENPDEPRTSFYLAQSYECLHNYVEAFRYYKYRQSFNAGFHEEIFQAQLRMGNLAQILGHPWYDCMKWYMLSYETIPRAEPLLNICEKYRCLGQWQMAYHYCKMACELDYPINCILFVDRESYNYVRWNKMGIIGYYAKQYEDGKLGCLKAINARNLNEDKQNLKFYISTPILSPEDGDVELLKLNKIIRQIKKKNENRKDKKSDDELIEEVVKKIQEKS